MNKIIDYYNGFDEWGRLDREPLEFMVNWHHIRKHLPPGGHLLDNGAGPGKYALELAAAGYQVTLTDLVPRLVEIARDKAEERGLAGQFQGFHAADARHLGIFADEQFDASLMMGPLYHLQAEEDRHAAVQEMYRVTKRGGIVFVAVMTVVRHVMNSLLHPQHWKPNDSIRQIRGFMETGIFNHQDEGRFTGAYYFRIEEIAPFMEAHGFETVQLLGSSSIAGAMNEQQFDYWRSRGEDEYRQALELIYEMASCPYVLGVSSHLLYIGRRK